MARHSTGRRSTRRKPAKQSKAKPKRAPKPSGKDTGTIPVPQPPQQGANGDAGWVNKKTLLALLGVSGSYFDRDIRSLIGEQDVRWAGPGRPMLFRGRAVLQAWAQRRAAGVGEPPVDPLLAGTDSPALEEYRRERAILARLDRLEREGELLPRDAVHDILGRLAELLRDAGATFQREFGREAHAVLEEVLDGFEREIEMGLGTEEDGSEVAGTKG